MIFTILGPVGLLAQRDAARKAADKQLSEHRVRGLLAALLLRPNRFVAHTTLAELLWDDPPAGYRSNLRTYASGLRRCLNAVDPSKVRLESLRGSGGGGAYLLRVEKMELDADVFLRLIARAQTLRRNDDYEPAIQLLKLALELWHGPAGGCDIAGSSRLLAQLDAFNDLRLITQEDLNAVRLQRGEHRLVIPELRALLADHPYREGAWAQLIYAYHCSGDVEKALRTYREIRDILDRELGVEPGDELNRLHRALLDRDDARARSVIWPESDRLAVR
ncbi:AfsR/SARP family transcriptional regulator [Nonomuraea aurantiaca]|uniref:AfsR/SARP family transcriptional regulator n=1 Tax=Nonomuraea aurantiaca TaxID=2878562 RepID=UPI001CDA364D|nr:AfsR/SARP family transcriptional regulator [Nonomuraea aurantiaca]MCA2227197.1 AfsR/SARP family transcriptional regulator [Nonomuraea aurantiaca]